MTTPPRYIRGDATQPTTPGPKILAHVCNDQGGWGKGFVGAISRRWREPEQQYRAWYRGRPASGFALGAVQLVQVAPDLWVANMVAQRGYHATPEGPPIRYDAVERCLAQLAEQAAARGASVHMPRIGCGLAGGTWDRIEPLIVTTLGARGVDTTVYDFG